MAQHYAPEEVSGAVLATELAEDLVQRGHDVTFVTCAPNYPHGKIFPGYRNSLYQIEILNGVRVVRTWSYITSRKDFLRRLLNYGVFSVSAFFGGGLVGKSDIILCYSPPLPLGISAWLLSRLRRIPWVLRVEDLFPEAAVAAGILRNRFAIRIFEWLEDFLYKKADHISLISEGFRKNLATKGVPKEKLSVAMLWADPDLIYPMGKENDFRRVHSLENKFVVMYAGSLGHTSALDDVLEAALLLRDNPKIQFVIIGEGVKKESLMRFSHRHGLSNVLFLPFQPRDQFSEIMAAADVSLVTLNPNSASFSMPNKVFNIMASKRPILAVTPAESEVDKLIRIWKCGENVPVGQAEVLAETIIRFSKDTSYLEKLGENGRQALEGNFSRQHCVNIFEQTLHQVVG